MRAQVIAAMAVLLAACDPPPPREQATVPPNPSTDNDRFRELLEQQRSARATLEASVTTITADAIPGRPIRIEIRNVDGPPTSPDQARVTPDPSAVAVDNSDCRRPVDPNGACTLVVTPQKVITGPQILVIAAANSNPVTIDVVPGPPPAPTAASAPSQQGPARQPNPLAYQALTTIPAEPARPQAQPQQATAVPVPANVAITRQNLISPPRDHRRVIGRGRHLELKLDHPILTTRTGQFTAHLAYPVKGEMGFDGSSPVTILPQGTRFIGTYAVANVVQARVVLTVNEIRDPANRTLAVLPAPVADAEGKIGVPATVDQRLGVELVGRLLSTVVEISPLLLLDQDETQVVTATSIISRSNGRSEAARRAADGLRSTTQDLLRRLLDGQERAGVGAGSTMTIQTENDWRLVDPANPQDYAEWMATVRRQNQTAEGPR